MFLTIAVVFECNNMEITKARGQFSHSHHAHTDFILTHPFTLMIAILFQQNFKLFMQRCCHNHLSSWYFNTTPPSSQLSTWINFSGIASFLLKPEPATIVGAV